MKVVAKSEKGHEFLYNPKSAHEVSNASAQYICSELNRVKYDLKENEVWFIHEVGAYDNAYGYASYQRFAVRKGLVYRRVA